MLLFSEEVFSSHPHNTAARMRACGANILAPGLPSSRPSPPASGWRLASIWEVVSSYSSATASDSHGIPRTHTHRFYKSRKELEEDCGGCGTAVKGCGLLIILCLSDDSSRGSEGPLRPMTGRRAKVAPVPQSREPIGSMTPTLRAAPSSLRTPIFPAMLKAKGMVWVSAPVWALVWEAGW